MVGAVLTGGASRRMGRTKATIEVGGVAMARRVADAMLAAGCASMIAFGGDPIELAPLGLEVISDSRQGQGPLAAVLGVLEHVASRADDTSWVVVAACDLPSLTGDDIGLLVERASERIDLDAIVARSTRLEPTCAAWQVAAASRLRSIYDDGERALHAAIALLDTTTVDLDPRAMTNINTRGDLDRYP